MRRGSVCQALILPAIGLGWVAVTWTQQSRAQGPSGPVSEETPATASSQTGPVPEPVASAAPVSPSSGTQPPGVAEPRSVVSSQATTVAVAGNARPPSWVDSIQFGASVDTYYALNYRAVRPQVTGTTARGFDANNGFNLAWVGLDATYEPAPVGATMQLRFGPYASIAYAGVDGTRELQYVKQAFGRWRPGGRDGSVTLDIGKFDAIVGAEAHDSWANPNYTRGVLFWLGQPLFHVGARATWQLTPSLDVKVMAHNGWNQNVDVNAAKSYGLQVNYTAGTEFGAALTWPGGPEQPDTYVRTAGNGMVSRFSRASNNWRFRHLVDLVLKAQLSNALSLALNADWGTESVIVDQTTLDTGRMTLYGGMLVGRYALSDVFAAALRGEVYADPQGYTFAGYVARPDATGGFPRYAIETGTLTLEVVPTPNLVVRLDNRVDVANEYIFRLGLRDTARMQVTSTMGVVFKTN